MLSLKKVSLIRDVFRNKPKEVALKISHWEISIQIPKLVLADKKSPSNILSICGSRGRFKIEFSIPGRYD